MCFLSTYSGFEIFFDNVRFASEVVLTYFRRYFLRMFYSARFAELVNFPKMFNNVRFSRRLSKITEDALFAELGGFSKG